jgi:hypothetical protein
MKIITTVSKVYMMELEDKAPLNKEAPQLHT